MHTVLDGERVAYRIDEICKLTGLSRSTIYLEISAGRLRVIKCGNRTLVLVEACKAWLDSLPAKTN